MYKLSRWSNVANLLVITTVCYIHKKLFGNGVVKLGFYGTG